MGSAAKETPSALPVEVDANVIDIDEVKTNPLAERVIKLLNDKDSTLLELIKSEVVEIPRKKDDALTLFEIYVLFIRKMRRIYSRFYPNGALGIMLAVKYRLKTLNPERQARHLNLNKEDELIALDHPDSELNKSMRIVISATLADEEILNILRKLNSTVLAINLEPENLKFLSFLAECLKETI